ncbi:MAG TPA: NapC/NirT family cytochrome c, partial [Pseudobdellovibrionaceae bacterium]|nr:NapC/NirT family cytochrome c [Pseudobdellovibrionaceae bacterium]
MLVGLGIYVFIYAKGYSYMSDDPQACINCHIMRENLDTWSKSTHHHVAKCNDCHLPHNIIG